MTRTDFHLLIMTVWLAAALIKDDNAPVWLLYTMAAICIALYLLASYSDKLRIKDRERKERGDGD